MAIGVISFAVACSSIFVGRKPSWHGRKIQHCLHAPVSLLMLWQRAGWLDRE
jgi:hypothetical protein